MTMAIRERQENHRLAFRLLIQELGDRAIETKLFDSTAEPFASQIIRTTWEEIVRAEYVEAVGARQYRLTAKGWVAGLEITELAQSREYEARLGRLFAAMKAHVKPRETSAIVDLATLAVESGEPVGWIFNVIDSKASTTTKRTGAGWYAGERGGLVEIPVDFNLEPIDIAAALTVGHLERIQELEERLEEVEEDRAQFHCPHCDAPVSSIGYQDYPEHHCIVTYQSYGCGYLTGDDQEEKPCPYGPRWPQLDEFDFVTEQSGAIWFCHAVPNTDRARRVDVMRQSGKTRDEAEMRARAAAAPKKKSERPLARWLNR
jgi:hypothetical protein